MNSGFVDLHSHVLPGLDDGPASMEETAKMLEVARKDGISIIVATPHYTEGKYEPTYADIEKKIASVKEMFKSPEILFGADIRISPIIPAKLRNGALPSINNNKYILLEFPSFSMPPINSLKAFVMEIKETGHIPVITHPERNAILINNTDLTGELIEIGFITQVTAMSITGELGKEVKNATLRLFNKGFVHSIATDAHDSVKRPPVMSRAYEKIKKEFGEDTARMVTIDNPYKIIMGDNII